MAISLETEIEIFEAVLLALRSEGFTAHEPNDYGRHNAVLTHPDSKVGSLIVIDYKGDLWVKTIQYDPLGERVCDRTDGKLIDEFTLEMADPQVFKKFKQRVCNQ